MNVAVMQFDLGVGGASGFGQGEHVWAGVYTDDPSARAYLVGHFRT